MLVLQAELTTVWEVEDAVVLASTREDTKRPYPEGYPP
jgi:hypothetical protein